MRNSTWKRSAVSYVVRPALGQATRAIAAFPPRLRTLVWWLAAGSDRRGRPGSQHVLRSLGIINCKVHFGRAYAESDFTRSAKGVGHGTRGRARSPIPTESLLLS